jgi:hypothetical protein
MSRKIMYDYFHVFPPGILRLILFVGDKWNKLEKQKRIQPAILQGDKFRSLFQSKDEPEGSEG